ncbi:hypothetical protein BH10PSE7_BH10PSE7_03580 [soil metagenome]
MIKVRKCAVRKPIIAAIGKAYRAGMLIRRIAKKFGISEKVFARIRRQEGWPMRIDRLGGKGAVPVDAMGQDELIAFARRSCEVAQRQLQSGIPAVQRVRNARATVILIASTLARIGNLSAKETSADTSSLGPQPIRDARRLELARRLEGLRRELGLAGDGGRAE